MSAWKSPLVLLTALGAMGAYGLLFVPAAQGWGYPGHGGFHRSGSIFYWGGVNTWHGPSVRSGSRGGPGLRGGGLHSGK